MPRNAAVVRLNALIDSLPSEPAIDISPGTIAADLVALLPSDEEVNLRSPDRVFAAVRSRPRAKARRWIMQLMISDRRSR